MKFVIGLGNPGEKYENTRHNAGFTFVNYLAQKNNVKFNFNKKTNSQIIKLNNLVLAKPQNFMNNSGQVVQQILNYYNFNNLKNLYIVHDDLDLELGHYKIQFGIGPKIHNGLNDIYSELKTKNFWHLRIGIDSRQGDRSMPAEKYVLQKFNDQELEILKNVIEQASQELLKLTNATQ